MIIKKLRLQRNWSQDQLAQFSGLSIRTIQRMEKGKPANIESYKSVAAVFEVNFEDLKPELAMNTENDNSLISQEETDAFEYVQNLKSFYLHLMAFFAVMTFMVILNLLITPNYYWFKWAALGWGISIVAHAIRTFGRFGFLNNEWEKRQIEKHLGRKL